MEKIESFYVTNTTGVNGITTVESGLVFAVAGPSKQDYTKANPEVLLGASWATCLNATLKTLLLLRNKHNSSQVTVKVDLVKDSTTKQLNFHLDAYVLIEDLPIEEGQRFMHEADERCPVSKLLNKQGHVQLHLIQAVTEIPHD